MKIAIITGGETGEREISIKSSKNIENSIKFTDTAIFIFPEDKDKFLSSYKNFDLVIPVIHGIGGEDGSIQGFLRNLQIPFLFSDIETHAIAIDKKITKEIIKNLKINSPENTEKFPMFVKPRFGGSSIASKLCKNKKELLQLNKENPEIEFVKEKPIKGREFTVGVIECKNKTFSLPVIEIVPKGEFFDFKNKYDKDNLASEICPAKIPTQLKIKLQKQALEVHKYLNAKHISRSDFIVTPQNKIYFLEINTIPGMTETSLIPKMLKQQKINLTELIKYWCK